MSINGLAISLLSPERLTDGRYAYWDDAARRYFVVTADDLNQLTDPEQYSEWCANTTAEEMPAGWQPGASASFDLLDGIINSDYRNDLLGDVGDVINYAEAAGQSIHYSQAERLIAVGKHWVKQMEAGNGEWSRMRDDAKRQVEL